MQWELGCRVPGVHGTYGYAVLSDVPAGGAAPAAPDKGGRPWRRRALLPLLRGKTKYCLRVKNRIRLQQCAGKIRMIRRIWKMLRFQAKSGSLPVSLVPFAFRAVEKIPAVELHPGLAR